MSEMYIIKDGYAKWNNSLAVTYDPPFISGITSRLLYSVYSYLLEEELLYYKSNLVKLCKR